jgi:hypothetical protein
MLGKYQAVTMELAEVVCRGGFRNQRGIQRMPFCLFSPVPVAAKNVGKEICVAESDVGAGLGRTSSLLEMNLVDVRLQTSQQLTTVVVMATGNFSL